MQQYHVTMPNGSVWGVPVSAIARSHAKYYAQYETLGDVEKCFKEHSLPLLTADPKEVWEWAAGNMDWADVQAIAWLVSGRSSMPKGDYQEGWVNGEHKVVDVEEAEFAPPATAGVDLCWLNAANILPVLEQIPANRRGMVEVAERHDGEEWFFGYRYGPNVEDNPEHNTYWRYLPDAPGSVA